MFTDNCHYKEWELCSIILQILDSYIVFNWLCLQFLYQSLICWTYARLLWNVRIQFIVRIKQHFVTFKILNSCSNSIFYTTLPFRKYFSPIWFPEAPSSLPTTFSSPQVTENEYYIRTSKVLQILKMVDNLQFFQNLSDYSHRHEKNSGFAS